MSDRSPTMAAVLTHALRRHTDSLRVSLPGRIESFDAATQTADILPLVRQTDTKDGREVINPFPVLPSVPVLFPGGGFYSATFPVQRGDTCWVVFGDYSIEEWWTHGGVVTPADLELHGLNGAVAFVGCRAKPDVLDEFDTSRAVFGGFGPRVACDGAAVHLGVAHNESAQQAVIRGDAHLDALGKYLDAIVDNLKLLITTGKAGTISVVSDQLTTVTAALTAAKTVYNTASHSTRKALVP